MKNKLSYLWAFLIAFTLPFTNRALADDTNAITKTSFNAVTSQLDPGGDFYLYLSTARWLEHLNTYIESWRGKMMSLPNAKAEDLDNINKAFDLIGHLTADSGIQDLDGVGISSVEVEPGMYRTKGLLHHAAGAGTGFMWQLGGAKPHALTGLNLLPANTALAMFSDTDIPKIWSVVEDEAIRSGIPQAQESVRQVPAQFEKATKIGWTAFLNSLGGEVGVCLTLDESNPVPIPLPSGLINIPEPGLFIALRVNDDTIFNRIAEEMKTNGQTMVTEKTGLRMRTMPVPIPMAINLRPTEASSGGYLFIASSDTLIQDVLAVRDGNIPGLKDTKEFKHISQNIPEQGNQFCFVSPVFGRTVASIQEQVLSAKQAGNPAQTEWMRSLFNQQKPAYSYCVGANTPEGYLSVGNGSQSGSTVVLLPMVAVGGVMAAVAIPNFVKARETAQRSACINNLRQIDAAKSEWALENNKTNGVVPTEADLAQYIRNGMPKCPAGGTYTIGPIGEKPTCSLPGHVLR